MPMPPSTRYVVLEWNQASGQPELAVDAIYDDLIEAGDLADAMRAEAVEAGRRERYTVHEVDMDEVDR